MIQAKENNQTGEENECTVREQDRFMPIANVIRIMRKILPPHAKISDDAKETIQECVSEYISFITGEANERCQREQRKTITAEDVLWAMSKLGFDDYIEPLTMYLHRYREVEGDRTSIRGEPLGKRTVEYATLGVAAAAFVPPPFHHNGYFASYIREQPPNAASSHHHHGISNAEPNARSI
ncbi:Nuclear transcription factor Y subunit B-6, partial [Mucuna pruriens]